MRFNAGYLIYRAIYEGISEGLQQVVAQKIPSERLAEFLADSAITQVGYVVLLEDEQLPVREEVTQMLAEPNEAGPLPPTAQ